VVIELTGITEKGCRGIISKKLRSRLDKEVLWSIPSALFSSDRT